MAGFQIAVGYLERMQVGENAGDIANPFPGILMTFSIPAKLQVAGLTLDIEIQGSDDVSWSSLIIL